MIRAWDRQLEQLEFPDNYFEDEWKEGFYVESMMKRAWAAQLVVLKEINRICKKYNIAWFADWGTLLGTVRHKGFIPWDDDIDIAMKRQDYEKFLLAASKELEAGWVLLEPKTEGFHNAFSRVCNGWEISFEEEHMKRFFGCPYVVGIDIFPLDVIPLNKEDEEMQCEMIDVIARAAKLCRGNSNHCEEALAQIEALLNVKIDREREILSQLFDLGNKIYALYSDEEGEELTLMSWFVGDRNFRLKKEWYDEAIWMPFENILMPVPACYESVLEKMYGEWRIPVQNAAGHEYPFYKDQQRAASFFTSLLWVETGL